MNPADADTETGMFSAASFSAVLSAVPRARQIDATPEIARPPTIAFYGFRGGSGRTTALAHIAAMLAGDGRSVVAIDLDVEAPGLHHVLGCPTPTSGRGSVALLRAAITRPDDPDALRLTEHVTKAAIDVAGTLRVIPAGPIDERYLLDLDDLAVPLWHLLEGHGPIGALVARVKDGSRKYEIAPVPPGPPHAADWRLK